MTFPTQPFLRPVPLSIRNIAICALLTLGSVQIDAQTSAIKPGEPVTLNFTGAEIEAVARTLATLSGRNVVVDPRVKGTMTLVTERLPRCTAMTRLPARTSLARSITITSAPMSASIMPAKGPGPMPANSMTRRPLSGP